MRPVRTMLRRFLAVGLAAATFAAVGVGGAEATADRCPRRVKNIIVMISDGWGYNQIKATNYFEGVRGGKQVYERFPVRVGMSTYNISGSYDPASAWASFNYVNSGYTDSAPAATTMSTGVKTFDGAIGVDSNRVPLTHALAVAESLGKATGVVTSVEFSHATPAGFLAHNPDRNQYAALANEMIYQGSADVIMGAGHPCFDDNGVAVPGCTKDPKYVGGAATLTDLLDGAVTGADADRDGDADDWTVVTSREGFRDLMWGRTPARVLGIAEVYTTLQQARTTGDPKAAPFVVPLTDTVPTLEEMTRAALNILDNDRDGLFLMIEGGAVDWAGHGNQAGRLIEEQVDFNRSVQAVVDWVNRRSNWGETLLVVTGDHETGYLTGPGSGQPEGGAPVWTPVTDMGVGILPGMEWHSTSHTNSLIPLFARGEGAWLLFLDANQRDPVRGRYLDNAELGDVLFEVMRVDNPNH